MCSIAIFPYIPAGGVVVYLMIFKNQFEEATVHIRYHSRFFVQVGQETTNAAIENHHFFTVNTA